MRIFTPTLPSQIPQILLRSSLSINSTNFFFNLSLSSLSFFLVMRAAILLGHFSDSIDSRVFNRGTQRARGNARTITFVELAADSFRNDPSGERCWFTPHGSRAFGRNIYLARFASTIDEGATRISSDGNK